MRRFSKTIIISLALCLIAAAAFAKVDIPRPTGYVNDFAGVIDSGTIEQLNGLITAVKEKTTAEIAVAVMPTVEPETVEQYAERMFQKWGVGTASKDNGVLILVAMKERRVRIEVGYGLEGAIPDSLAGNIIQDKVVPQFKAGNYAGGIQAGTEAVAELALKESGLALEDVYAGYTRQEAAPVSQGSRLPRPIEAIIKIIFGIILVILFIRYPEFFLFMLLSGGRGGGFSGRSGGSFGGGFGGFGGGMSGGGGSSGGW